MNESHDCRVQGKRRKDFVEVIWVTLLKTGNRRLIRFGHEKRLEFLARKMCELLIRRKRERNK